AAAAIAAAVNDMIFKNAQRKRGIAGAGAKELAYAWKFGAVRYSVSGEGSPVLLIHGLYFGCGRHEWRNNIGALSRRYKVYALDLIGFGFSEKPGISYSPYLYSTLINDFIREVIGEKTAVAANSESAAFVLAAYTFAPEQYSKLLLISPTGVGNARRRAASAKDKWLQSVLDSPVLGTSFYTLLNAKWNMKKFMAYELFSDPAMISDAFLDDCYAAAHDGGPNAKYAHSAYIANFLALDVERMIAHLSVPAHVVWGAESVTVPAANADVLQELNPEIELTVFANAKKLPHAENAKAFNALCQEFFG
ncbi:MAG: alpha/beta fold hydrolase, partial [Clostridiales bacterium]|nr:alpha/beta fold hydrolase [Clostridiales bacterium]